MKLKFFLICSLLASCGQASDSLEGGSQDTPELTFEVYSQQEEIPAPNSPFGFWEKSIQYPEFESSDKKELASNINLTLRALVEKYRCKNEGDQTFSANVRHQSASMLSITYEAMWMCPPMPHPDSTAGAINIDLRNGEEIGLRDQLQDQEAEEKFLRLLAQQRQKMVEAKACQPPSDFDYFYVEENEVRFVFQSVTHSKACTVTVAIPREMVSQFWSKKSALKSE